VRRFIRTDARCSVIRPHSIAATGIAGGSEKRLGWYVGPVEGLFYLCEACTIFAWGRLSDRIGRKPVLIIGVLGSALSTTCFGLSRTFYGYVGSRAICGLLNGNLGVLKCAVGETLTEDNAARGWGLMSSAWGFVVIIAPLLGASAAVTSRFQLIKLCRRPPCPSGGALWRRLCDALLVRASIRPNVLHRGCRRRDQRHRRRCVAQGGARLEDSQPAVQRLDEPERQTLPSRTTDAGYEAVPLSAKEASFDDGADFDSVSPTAASQHSLRSLLAMPSVRLAAAAYASLSLVEIAYQALITLWAHTSLEAGGLGLSEAHIGLFLAASGGCVGVTQAFLFAPLQERLGPRLWWRLSMALFAGCFLMLPLANLLALRVSPLLGYVALALVTPFLCVGESGYSSVYQYVTGSAPKEALGAVNGLNQTFISFIRAVGPMTASAGFAASITHNILGGAACFLAFAAFSLWSAVVIGDRLPVDPNVSTAPKRVETAGSPA
jgi:MFS family permease